MSAAQTRKASTKPHAHTQWLLQDYTEPELASGQNGEAQALLGRWSGG